MEPLVYRFGVMSPSFDEDLRQRVARRIEELGLTPKLAFASIWDRFQPANHRFLLGNHRCFLKALRGTAARNDHLIRATERWLLQTMPAPHAADGKALAAFRASRNLSPTQLAARLGISASTMYELERGRHAPRRKVRDRIRRVVGLPLFQERA